jgi:hypothetical protein
MHPNTFRLSLLLGIIGIIGMIVLWQATGTQVAVSQDSEVYLEGANQINKDGSFAIEVNDQLEVILPYIPFYWHFFHNSV